MAKIQFNDAFGEGFEKDLQRLVKLFKALGVEARELNKAVKSAKTFDSMQQSAKKAATATNNLTASEKKLLSAQKRLEFAQSSAGKEHAKITEKIRLQNAANKRLAKSQLGVATSTNKWGNAVKSFQLKFNALGNIIANFTQVALRQLMRAFKSTFNIVSDFDKAMADVKSITKASKSDMDALTKSAMKLGGSTKFTASQVAQLQKEYAKLGLTTEQILNAQAATLDLAAATTTELPRAAEVVGITLKQFGLAASEANRVTDVMAESFTSSALDMEKFAESMKFVGPAAKASGISIERTTAILGQLADAGISGSMAGTSLRQIMLALSKESGTFSEKIKRAAESGLDLAGATEEVQKRAATSLLVLADGVDTIDDYTEALENAAGASQSMADVQLDTLKGKIDLVKSAWEGMILQMLNTEENISGVKWALQGIITLLNAMALRADTVIEGKHGKKRLSLSEAFAIEKTVTDLGNLAIQMDKTNKANEEFYEGFTKSGLKEFGEFAKEFGQGVWKTMFPDAEQPIQVLADVSKELKKLKEDEKELFEDDQEYSTFWTDLEAQSEKAFSAVEKYANSAFDVEMEELATKTEAYDQYYEQRKAAERELKDIKIATANEAFNFVSALSDRRLAKVEADLASEVISEEQADAKKKKIQRQSAIIEKAQSLFNIALSTAEGVLNYGKSPITAPLIPFIIGLGAAQAATVIATPIPAFAKGTDSAPGGRVVVGEEGHEIVQEPGGRTWLTPDTASVMNIRKGSIIRPADVTNELLRMTSVMNGMGGVTSDSATLALMGQLRESNEKLRREIKNKPAVSSILTPAGILTATHKGNTTIKRLDKFYK